MVIPFKQTARQAALSVAVVVLLCCAVYGALILGAVLGLTAALGGL